MEQIHGTWVKGPMKWIFLILGPNHHAKDIKALLTTEYNNLNIIVVLVTNANVSQVIKAGNNSSHDPIESGAGPGGNLLA